MDGLRLSVFAFLLLAACGRAPDAQDIAIDDPANETGPANGAGENSADAAIPAGTIPSAFHGRWGITENDCVPTRADAKGAIIIGEKTIRFYESVATLATPKSVTAERVEAQFSLSGEGMTWSEPMVLVRDGDTLERTVSGPEQTLTYKRC